jgi:uncharacterized protein YneF (UPF0154 family)
MILDLQMPVGSLVGIIIVCVLAGLLIGFFGARFFFKHQLKKNPPINEKQIRAMYQQMGRTPSEKQVRATMRAINENASK